MGFGRLEAQITVPTGGWGFTVDDSGGGGSVAGTIAAGTYSLSGSDGLLQAFKDALNTAATTDTFDVTISHTAGKVTVTSTGTASVILTSTDLQELLGFASTTLSTGTTWTSDYQTRSLWYPDGPYEAPNAITASGWHGHPESDVRFVESMSGYVYGLSGQQRLVTPLRWTGVKRARCVQANESTTNESFERFVRDGVWGFAAWGTPGGPVRYYPDETLEDYVKYAVPLDKLELEHMFEGWAGGPWKCGFDRMVKQGTSSRSVISVASKIAAASSTAGASSIATTSFQVTAGKLNLAYVVSSVTSGAPNQPTASGGGAASWVVVQSLVYQTTRRITVFRALDPSPTASAALTFSFGGQTQNSFVWHVVEVTGADKYGIHGAGAIVQNATRTSPGGSTTTETCTLAALENSANAHLNGSGANAEPTFTPSAGFTETGDDSETADSIALETSWALNRVACTPTASFAIGWGMISVEVRAARV